MKYRIDLHVHSRFSADNDSDPEEMILRAIELGLHGIAFTEHDRYAASEPVESLKEKYGSSLIILRGVEYSTGEGHCLVFGADTDGIGVKHASIAQLIDHVERAGGVVIPSHPFRPGTSIGELVSTMKGLTALEGCNGANMHVYNERAIAAAGALNMPYTGGSDAHEPREVGSCFTEFDQEVSYKNVIELLKAGNYRGVDTRKISRAIVKSK